MIYAWWWWSIECTKSCTNHLLSNWFPSKLKMLFLFLLDTSTEAYTMYILYIDNWTLKNFSTCGSHNSLVISLIMKFFLVVTATTTDFFALFFGFEIQNLREKQQVYSNSILFGLVWFYHKIVDHFGLAVPISEFIFNFVLSLILILILIYVHCFSFFLMKNIQYT